MHDDRSIGECGRAANAHNVMRKRHIRMDEWEYIITIPGVKATESVYSNELGFVGPTDEKYQVISSVHPNMKKYLDSFHDIFGSELPPSMIIRRKADSQLEHWQLSQFRNTIAIPTVMKSRLMNYKNPYPNHVPYTDLFEFCLANMGRDYEHIVFRTPSETGGGNDVEGFTYNPNPSIIHPHLFKLEYDELLMMALIKLYDDNSRNRDVKEFKKKVFRSLEMVFYALKAFTPNLGTAYDYGFVVSLWVPAFEILANPLSAPVSYRKVEELINRVPWLSKELRRKNYKRVNYNYGKKGKHEKVSLPVQVYSRLHYMRNLILHGSPIDEIKMEPKNRERWIPLIIQAPALYRCTLLNMLCERGYGEYPPKNETFEGIWMNRNYFRYYEEILFKPPKKNAVD